MREEVVSQANANLQLLLDRYSLSKVDFDPAALAFPSTRELLVTNAEPRAGHLYGELTRHGLAHVWADDEKTQHARAHALIIDDSYVWAGTHTYNRRSNETDWRNYTDIYQGIPISSHADDLKLMPYELAIEGKTGLALERAQKIYAFVVDILAQFPETSSRYDALHQTVAHKRPPVPEAWAPLDPYAGQTYGPRVNLEEMAKSGVPFHPAVLDALDAAPDMTIIE